MKLEFHQLDRRYEHLRVHRPDRQRRLLASLAASGQQTPIVVVTISNNPDRYLVIDGYKRLAALQKLGHDTVEATIWPMNEADALVLERSMRLSERDTALEEGWLLQELEQRFGYNLDDLARRFDRSVSWVSRRLALVEQLPQAVQQQVRSGDVSAHAAMKCVAPVARANLDDGQRMADAFARHHFSSRQAGELYAAWRDASSSIRQRILESPDLFLKAQQQVQPQPPPLAEELLRDLNMVLAITQRARRRLARAAPLMGRADFDDARRKIDCAVADLTHLAEQIEKEKSNVESRATGGDSGTLGPGSGQAGDCPPVGNHPLQRPQSPSIEVLECTGVGSTRESRAVPPTDSRRASPVRGQPGSRPRRAAGSRSQPVLSSAHCLLPPSWHRADAKGPGWPIRLPTWRRTPTRHIATHRRDRRQETQGANRIGRALLLAHALLSALPDLPAFRLQSFSHRRTGLLRRFASETRHDRQHAR